MASALNEADAEDILASLPDATTGDYLPADNQGDSGLLDEDEDMED